MKNYLNIALRVEQTIPSTRNSTVILHILFCYTTSTIVYCGIGTPAARCPKRPSRSLTGEPAFPVLFLFLPLSLFFFSLFSPPSSSSSLYLPLIDHPRSSLYSQCSLLVRPSTSSRSGLSPLPPARCVLLCCSQLPRYAIHSQCNRELC